MITINKSIRQIRINNFETRMGNLENQKTQQITFVQILQDKNFGEIQIYRNQSGKFIMKELRTFIHNPSDIKYQQFKSIINQFQQLNKSNKPKSECFVPILFSKYSEKKNLCIMYQTIEIYCEYFNHTLQDLVTAKMKLATEQIWMCFRWMLDLIKTLDSNNWAIQGGLNLSKIFVTPRGRIVFYYNFLTQRKDIKIKEYMTKETQVQQDNTNINPEYTLIMQAVLCILSLINQTAINQKSQITQNILKKCEQTDIALAKLIQNILEAQKNHQQNKINANSILELIDFWTKERKIKICKQIILNRAQLNHSQNNISTRTISEMSKKKPQRVTPIKIIKQHKHKNSFSVTKRTDRESFTKLDKTDRIQMSYKELGTTLPMSSFKQNILVNSVQEESTLGLPEQRMKKWLSSKKSVYRNPKSGLLQNKQNLLENSIHLLPTSNRRQSFLNKSKREKAPIQNRIKITNLQKE